MNEDNIVKVSIKLDTTDIPKGRKDVEKEFDKLNDGIKRSAQKSKGAFGWIEVEVKRAAQQAHNHFSSHLSANFFAGLLQDGAKAIFRAGKQFIEEAKSIAAETQNAFSGLKSISIFQGIDDKDAQRAVQNLRFVKGGIISVAEASTALKNLLSTGFNLKQSVDLLERFSDAAAFGKQAALSYGRAIESATEGIKNQNSILVDNVGITKNISKILEERGFKMEDLSNKTKGASAQQALYNGLLVESAAQVGDADKMMQGYTGSVAANDQAMKNLKLTVGEWIINNPAYVESMKIVTEQINGTTEALKDQRNETNKTANEAIIAFAKIKSNLIPFAAFVKNTVLVISNGLGLIFGGSVGIIENMIEKMLNNLVTGVNAAKNILKSVGAANLPGATQFAADFINGPDVKPFTFASTVNETMRQTRLDFDKAIQGVVNSSVEGANAWDRVHKAFENREKNQTQAVQDNYTKRNKLDQQTNDLIGKETKARAQRIKDDADNFKLSDIKEIGKMFKDATGRSLPFSAFGQSRYHNKIGLDHSQAADVALNPNSTDGKILIQLLEEQGIPFRAFGGAYRRKDGVLTATGAHIHVGAASRGFGAKTKSLAPNYDNDVFQYGLDGQGNLIQVNKSLMDNFRAGVKARSGNGLVSNNGSLALGGVTPMLTRDQEFRRGIDEQMNEGMTELVMRQRNFAEEITDIWKQAAIDRGHYELDLVADLTKAESDLASKRELYADSGITQTRRMVQIRSEEAQLLDELNDSQDRLATSGANAALRVQVAWSHAMEEIRDRSMLAYEDMARAQAELSDQTVFHADQMRAAVMSHAANGKGVTQIWSDAYISIMDKTGDAAERAIGKLTNGMGAFGDIITNVLGDLTRMVTNRLMMKVLDQLFGVKTGGAGPVAGGSGGGILSGVIGGLFGGRGGSGASAVTPFLTGGFAGGASPAGSFLSVPSFDLMGGAPGFGGSLTSQIASNNQMRSIISQTQGVAGTGAGAAAGAVGGPLGSFGASLAPMLPLLGASIGFGLGGPSKTGSIIGSAGGLLLGGAGAVGLLGGAGAGIFASGGALGALGGAAALLTNPFTIAVGVGLLVGGWLLGKAKQRKKEEQMRDELRDEAYKLIADILAQVKAGKISGESGAASATQVMNDYYAQVSQFKTKSVIKSAENFRGAFNSKIMEIKNAGVEYSNKRSAADRIVPEFSSGGVFNLPRGMAGAAILHGQEIVVGTQHQTPAVLNALAGAGVPDVRTSGNAGGAVVIDNMTVQLSIGRKDATEITVAGLSSSRGQKFIVGSVIKQQEDGEL